MLLVERGNTQDVEAWSEHVVHKVATEVFQAGAKSMSTTCTIGLGPVPAEVRTPDGPANDAFKAHRQGRESGGNRVQLLEHTGMMLRLQDQDRLWVKQIKAALMENRFRLVQQPIASLVGEDLGMYDVLVRMLDEQGQEVLPSVFMPAAERNDLMKNVDRWVVGAAMSFCAARKPGALFVRLSQDTLADASLPSWLANQLKSTRIEPARIVFQVRRSRGAADQGNGRAAQASQRARLPLCARGLRHGARHGIAPQPPAAGLREDSRRADGGPLGGPGQAVARKGGRGARAQMQGRDDRRTRAGRQYDGGALAARRRVHPGLLRQRA
jgi:hypothetical protein